MSRSFRKTPVLTDPSTNHRYQPRMKAIANRTVRRRLKQQLYRMDGDNVLNPLHNSFKKLYPSYDIVDYRADLRACDRHTMSAADIREYYNK